MNSHSFHEKIKIDCLKTLVKVEPHEDEELEDYINLSSTEISLKEQFKSSKNRKSNKKCLERTYRSSRLASKASAATSEVSNIYAKPRMHFTGRGIITKSQGYNIFPKSKRGRKIKCKVIKEEFLEEEPVLEVVEENIAVSEEKFDKFEYKKEENYHEINCEVNSEMHFENSKDVEEMLSPGNEDNIKEEKHVLYLKEKEEKHIGNDEEDDLPIKYFPNRKMFKRVGHTSDNTVECTVCFKQIKGPSMKQHYKTHSGAKPFQCSHCGARFTRKGDVLRHRKTIHQSIKPFQCVMCDRQFSGRKSLMLHLENHDKTLFYTCKTCGFKFGKKEYYENHILYMHPLAAGETITDIANIAIKGSEQLESLTVEESKELAIGKKCTSHLSVSVSDVEVEDVDSPEECNNYSSSKEDDDNDDCIFFAEDSSSKFDADCYNSSLSSVECDNNNYDSDSRSENTEVYVEKGTLNLTQKLSSNIDSKEDEELVNQAINAAVSQAESALETIQLSGGNNMTTQFNMHYKSFKNVPPESLTKFDDKKMQPKSSEIHINASVGGQIRKFIIQIPSGCNIDPTTQEGMDTIVNMVNYLCSGKGELNGPIEVTMHHNM